MMSLHLARENLWDPENAVKRSDCAARVLFVTGPLRSSTSTEYVQVEGLRVHVLQVRVPSRSAMERVVTAHAPLRSSGGDDHGGLKAATDFDVLEESAGPVIRVLLGTEQPQ